MELRNIDTFLKVAATQNFSKAAEQLGYSQSAVTVQIQKLEKELDVQLFDRIGKHVYLTEKGQEFISYASTLMKAAHSALIFSKKEGAVRGTLRIGGVESICTALLPDLLPDFCRLCPEVEVVIRSGVTENLLELAAGNEVDLVFTLDRRLSQPEWTCAMQKEEDVVFVTQPGKKFPPERIIPIQELAAEPFILTEPGGAYHYELERLLSQRDIKIRPILETGNTETIIKLLKKGMGVSFLPKFTVRSELESGELIQLRTDLPGIRMHHQIFYHKNKWVTRQMQLFLDLVRQKFFL